MQLDAITLFPDIFRALTGWGVTGRAAQRQRYHLRTWNPRDFTQDRHRTVDDRPYGGGPGPARPRGGDEAEKQRREGRGRGAGALFRANPSRPPPRQRGENKGGA